MVIKIDRTRLNQQIKRSLDVQGSIPARPPLVLYTSSTSSALLLDIANRHGMERRPAQLTMATLIEQAIEQGIPAVIEAATGTGKGRAYGTPAVLSGKKVVISTGNKALQKQLVEKDMPYLYEHVRAFQFAEMKGEGNYICLDRLHKYGEQEAADASTDEAYRQVRALTETSGETFTGDFESRELSFVPAVLKREINRDGDLCAGKDCPLYEQCYYYRMRREAEAADVVITNHSLLTINAAKGGRILPAHDVVVLDEAHHLEDEATEAFTVKVTESRVVSLLKLKTLQAHTHEKSRAAILRAAAAAWQELARRFPANEQKVVLDAPVQEGLKLASLLDELASAFRKDKPDIADTKESKLYDKLVRRAERLADELRQVFTVKDTGYVYFMQWVGTGGKRSIEVSQAPLSVASFLRETLFQKYTVICTSATLATGSQDFTYFTRRVGLDKAERLILKELPTVFDYGRNALLYIPRDVPPPPSMKNHTPAVYASKRAAYEQAIIERMLSLVRASGGRAFLLFCSHAMKEKAYARFLSANLPYPLLCQEEGVSRDLLKAQFCQAGNAVLFGVKTFWEGIDVPGDALSLVVIDKLPFGVPGDPVEAARIEQIKAAKLNYWNSYIVPRIILQLKQGVGRLIRSSSDSGVMAILDTRLHIDRDRYGKAIIDALPGAKRTVSLQDVETFFQERAGR